MDITACEMAGRNSSKEMGIVSFSLMSYDKVRVYMKYTEFSDAGPIGDVDRCGYDSVFGISLTAEWNTLKDMSDG